ncbi:hypothetical protein HanPSC8_Chr17g0777991 [Helianthus annuus]|nr:hypothetical protein HanPSC8_Chr17g0777991 [Helianthus annuus]
MCEFQTQYEPNTKFTSLCLVQKSSKTRLAKRVLSGQPAGRRLNQTHIFYTHKKNAL